MHVPRSPCMAHCGHAGHNAGHISVRLTLPPTFLLPDDGRPSGLLAHYAEGMRRSRRVAETHFKCSRGPARAADVPRCLQPKYEHSSKPQKCIIREPIPAIPTPGMGTDRVILSPRAVSRRCCPIVGTVWHFRGIATWTADPGTPRRARIRGLDGYTTGMPHVAAVCR